MFTLKAFIALVVTWCLLAVAAVVAASTHRFEVLPFCFARSNAW
jgi:hypothetical protein